MGEVDWSKRLSDVALALRDARVARDEAIRAADAAGVGQTAIARSVGLSRMQVYRILTAIAGTDPTPTA
ncbi:DNA-binding phage protein [Microbacterium resistens]|uniref:DNA-binding phage protein n=1 Tax=Microbacterium resistens TaxID=156977 RepID=A0ABU1SE77_9MICO|nr:helix-turn-helix domain-containing protein [Microbacterium resistens]MDR6867558.1 DNA-binding phage protein [Microbacterium resistens]